MSILTKVAFLLGSLAPRRKLRIVFASTSSFTPRVMKECGITDVGRIVAISADRCSAFEPILAQRGELDSKALCLQVTQLGLDEIREHPDIRAWLLQCSDLPPYAHSLQRATALPLFDICTLIEHLQATAVRRGSPGVAVGGSQFSARHSQKKSGCLMIKLPKIKFAASQQSLASHSEVA